MRTEDECSGKLNAVLLQFHRMEAGFHQAREGLAAAVAAGRVPEQHLRITEPRLRAGELSYHRAEHRLSECHDAVWRTALEPD